MGVEWITIAFRNTIPEHPELRQILIHIPYDSTTFGVKQIGVNVCWEWRDLDYLLVQFWESRLTRPNVVCTAVMGEERVLRDFVQYLLPELTNRGVIDLTG